MEGFSIVPSSTETESKSIAFNTDARIFSQEKVESGSTLDIVDEGNGVVLHGITTTGAAIKPVAPTAKTECHIPAGTKWDGDIPCPEHYNTPATKQVYQKSGDFPPEKQALVAYASQKRENNLDFVATLDYENGGQWTTDVMHWNANGSYDKGICQFNSTYFMYIINDPNFDDPYWQIDQCWDLYTGWEARGIIGKRFFGYNHRHKSKPNFYLTEI